MGNQWIIYFESKEDIALLYANFTPKDPDAPSINKINIVDDFENT